MKSNTLPSFWKTYGKLSPDTRKFARKAYRFWAENSFHPSLHFKCINHEEDIWSIRITLGVRALGVLDGDTVTWFWIGNDSLKTILLTSSIIFGILNQNTVRRLPVAFCRES